MEKFKAEGTIEEKFERRLAEIDFKYYVNVMRVYGVAFLFNVVLVISLLIPFLLSENPSVSSVVLYVLTVLFISGLALDFFIKYREARQSVKDSEEEWGWEDRPQLLATLRDLT